jgi:myosin heavy subunit
MRDDDTQRFEQLKLTLKNVGFSKRHVAQTCQLIAAILHLGNLKFTIDRGRDIDAAVVHNQDGLALVAKFLGVTPSALETALSYESKLVKRELCTVFLDPYGAADNRDDLAKALYSMNTSMNASAKTTSSHSLAFSTSSTPEPHFPTQFPRSICRRLCQRTLPFCATDHLL